MLGCHGCQELLLDHLYDVLDDEDRRALLEHLGGCPACQAALEQARAQQRLLARASRLHFPEVTFTPPAGEPAAGPRPAVLPLRPRTRPWRRWAAAAAVLLALAGLAEPARRAREDYRAAQDALRAHDEAVAGARAQARAAR